jgi:hypothetical protein
MYLVATVCLWYLKAWKIGQIEMLAATSNQPANNIRLIPEELPESNQGQQIEAKISPFLVRLFRLQKV